MTIDTPEFRELMAEHWKACGSARAKKAFDAVIAHIDTKLRQAATGSADGLDTDADACYLQDSRSYVGNDLLFWARDGKGYTTDVRMAEVYTKERALAQHQTRETDIPWPKAYIDAHTRPAVDMQYVKRNEALAGTGIELRKPPRKQPDTINCGGCGRFIGGTQRYLDNCPHCDADNRP